MLGDQLLCVDDAFHPEVDVAVIGVVACLSESERESPAILRHSITVKRRQTPVRCGVRSYGVRYSSNILPDDGWTINCCLVGCGTEQTSRIWRRGPTCVVVLDEYVRVVGGGR